MNIICPNNIWSNYSNIIWILNYLLHSDLNLLNFNGVFIYVEGGEWITYSWEGNSFIANLYLLRNWNDLHNLFYMTIILWYGIQPPPQKNILLKCFILLLLSWAINIFCSDPLPLEKTIVKRWSEAKAKKIVTLELNFQS